VGQVVGVVGLVRVDEGVEGVEGELNFLGLPVVRAVVALEQWH
jgi:hypothetical protein